MLVMSLLNVLCGRDFAEKKVINLLTFAIEYCEDDFKEIMAMFVKQFNKIEADFFPHHFGTLIQCLALVLRKGQPPASFENFLASVASTLRKSATHEALFV